MCTPMFAGAPPPKFPGNWPTKDESSILEWNKNMIYYSRYLIDLCVSWLEKSSPLFERSTSGFCPISMNRTKNQQLLLNLNVFVFCPILLQKDIGVVIMKMQLLHGNNETLIGGQKWRKQITAPIIQNILQPIDVEWWIQMMMLLEDWEVLIYIA